jgi:glycosyltransferase involved in cell wall biosynthesis
VESAPRLEASNAASSISTMIGTSPDVFVTEYSQYLRWKMQDKEVNILFLFGKVNCNNGIASYCETLLDGLSKRKMRFFIASGPVFFDEHTRARRDALAINAVEWRIYPQLRHTPSIAEFIELARFVRVQNISVINVHGLSMLLWGRTLSLVTGTRLVAAYHPSASGDLLKVRTKAAETLTATRRLFLNLLFPDKLIVLSEESKKFIERNAPGFKKRVKKIQGGVNPIFRPPQPAERAEARSEFGYCQTDFVCLLLGRLSWNKGQDVLIEAVRIVRNQHPTLDLKGLFVGIGDAEQEIKKLVSSEELDRGIFRFLGYIDRPQHAMWAADVFVLPSRVEGFALVIAEAMATGLVPIRTPSGGALDQIVEGETGLLIPFDNPNALAKAIAALSDAERRKAMRANCVARAARFFSADAMCDSTRAVYEELSQLDFGQN